jgi:hypothetical protein
MYLTQKEVRQAAEHHADAECERLPWIATASRERVDEFRSICMIDYLARQVVVEARHAARNARGRA